MKNTKEKDQCILLEQPPLMAKQNLKEFSYWIAGLIDADGYIDKRGYIIISFNERDAHVANYIKTVIGKGSIYNYSISHSCQYLVRCKKGIAFLCKLIRNKLRNPKRIDQWNTRCVPKFSVPKTQNNYTQVKDNNSWLAGFIQGDGSFQIQINKRRKTNQKYRTFQIIVVIQISQKSNFLPNQIKKTFGGVIYYDKSQDCHIYSTSNQRNARKIIQYLDKYQLVGLGFGLYKIWRRAGCYILNKTPINLEKKKYRIHHYKENA